jgi:hypothetical protein
MELTDWPTSRSTVSFAKASPVLAATSFSVVSATARSLPAVRLTAGCRG